MDTLEKVKLTASIRHIGRFLKSRIPTYNSEVPDTAGRKKTTRRRRQTIAKRIALPTKAINIGSEVMNDNYSTFTLQELIEFLWNLTGFLWTISYNNVLQS